MKKIITAIALLVLIIVPAIVAGNENNNDKSALCYADNECNTLVVEIKQTLNLFKQKIKDLYQLFKRMAFVINKLPTKTRAEYKFWSDSADLNGKAYWKIYEADDWVAVLEDDTNTAIYNYDKDELQDIHNLMYDATEPMNISKKYLDQVKTKLGYK